MLRTSAALVAVLLLVPACTDSTPAEEADRDNTSPASESPSSTTPSTTPATRPRHRNRPTSWGPTRGEVQQARQIVLEMTLPELAGQVVVAADTGLEAPVDLVREHHFGGVIVFPDDVGATRQVMRSMAQLKTEVNRGYPLWTSVDQEGGIVARLGDPLTSFPTVMSLGATADPSLARRVARASGEELRAAGFVTGYAPVADVTAGPLDPTIGSRSLGSDPNLVARLVAASVRGYADAGVIAVAKHFPGHGTVGADSHIELPQQRAPLRVLARRDLVPFQAAVDAGVPAVMVGHLDVRAVDPGTPASISPKVIGVLRHRLGFQGVVLTDALNMGAIVDAYGPDGAVVGALKAGVDVILLPVDPVGAVEAISEAVTSGRLGKSRLREAATRMIALLLHTDRVGKGPVRQHEGVSLAESRAAVTVVDGPCGQAWIQGSAQPIGDSDAVAAFRQAAAKAGIDTSHGPVIRFIGYGGSAGTGDVVVSTDTPYVLTDSQARLGRIALFGDSPQAMTALIDVLTGRRRAPGHLPVDVPGLRPGCQ